MLRVREGEGDHDTDIILWGASIAGVIMTVGLVTAAYVGITGHRHPRQEATVSTGIGTGKPAQTDAESALAKADPAGQEDQTGGRAREIKATTRELELTAEQRGLIREIIAKGSAPRQETAGFELMVGTAVPQQIATADLPPKIAEIMNGYWGDQYLLVSDKLLIVDLRSRRVAAIVGDVVTNK
jgi:hypothetical protein